MDELNRLPKENYYKYVWRIDNLIRQGKYKNWAEITTIVNSQVDEEDVKGESGHRKAVKYARDFYENGVFDEMNDDKYHKELQIQIEELRKVKKQVQDQRREYNKITAIDGRAENLMEKLIESSERLNKERPLEFTDYIVDTSDKEAVLIFADWHYGMITDNIWNTYNTEICRKRVSELVSKSKTYLSLNKINKLNIVLLGDECHGGIHVSARVKSEEEVCDQLMNVSEIIAQAVEELSKCVNQISLYSTYGNHMRSIQNKNDSIHSDNMEKIIPWWLEQRLKENDKVDILYSDFKEFTKLKIFDYNICCVHGDLDNIKNIGITVNTIFSKLYNETIDYTISADKHHLEEFESYNIENILVRSLCGTDDYANDKRLYSKAGQTLMIFNREDGRESTYNIKLN